MRELARAEVDQLRSTLRTLLSTTLPTLLLPPSNDASLSCILELKAGAGGDEAALFTEEILTMYSNYARSQGWQITMLGSTPWGNGGGLRDAQLEIKGEGAYGKLRWESGVHRVQRVPATEKAGRTHTSTIAVMVSHPSLSAQTTDWLITGSGYWPADSRPFSLWFPQCLPIDDNPDVEDLAYVSEHDVEMQFMRSSGAGGQVRFRTTAPHSPAHPSVCTIFAHLPPSLPRSPISTSTRPSRPSV